MGLNSRVISFLLTWAICFSPCCYAQLRYEPAQHEAIQVSFLAEVDRLPHTTFGQNRVSYAGLLRSKNGSAEIVKLSYRFQDFEPEIPKKFLDQNQIHKFMAVREETCDEPQISFDAELPRNNQYATPPGTSELVRCYVITPADYKWSKSVKVKHE